MLLYFCLIFLGGVVGGKDVPPECLHHDESEQPGNPDVNCAVTNTQGPTLLVSTLVGGLFAIDKNTGSIRWKLMDEPVVKSPYDPIKPVLPAFLPDPKDGTLYMMGGSAKEPLKKLPFTIPQLVAASPSKSAEGILYSGKKVDTWFSVDRITGKKDGTLNYQGCMLGEMDTCPATSPGSFLIGRTEYNIMMYDTRTKDRKWNITYYDYSTNINSRKNVEDYELAHFSDSSTGALITLDRSTAAVRWETQLESPVVAMYLLEEEEAIINVPFTSVSIETLENLIQSFESSEGRSKVGETKLVPTLYVGEHAHGLFAVPSLVDKKTMLISPARDQPLLIEGPVNENAGFDANEEGTGGTGFNGEIPTDKSTVLVFGHYQVPEYKGPAMSPVTNPYMIAGSAYQDIKLIGSLPADNQTKPDDPEDSSLHRGIQQILQLNTTFIFSKDMVMFVSLEVIPHSGHILMHIENKELKLILLVVFFTVLWFIRFVKHQFRMWERFGTNHSNSASQGSVSSSTHYEVTASPVELATGEVRVGNISFDPQVVLGKGCEGTFVYKGKFDSRDVAVKRVLAACFSIADREVDLLRESDEHPNVIRYFCMEQCKQFRYIALELCAATLQDYIEGRYVTDKLDLTSVFRQSVQGLAHLHSLDIAHRDIKPQNVLISAPGKRGEVRAMISDFGLCKKLKLGRMSFSQRSGVAGTEGWIAPEMLLGHQSTTCMVDVFSMGCVYFYMLTGGKHPFGENFHRQANILSGRHDLSLLRTDENNETKLALIEKMLSFEVRERPPAPAILKHPVFWNKEKILTYLQEVSDRVDKEDEDSVVLLHLERGAEEVVRGDWAENLETIIRIDLRRQRTYRNSVRDLLRALRNKKHHYRELPDNVKQVYGPLPNQFTEYWCNKFPKLLNYVYNSMQCIKYEVNFAKYYDKNYDFIKQNYRPSGLAPPGSNQDSLFMRSASALSSTSVNSLVVSDWEDRHEDKLRENSSSSNMQPCFNQPSVSDQDSGRSLMGFVSAMQSSDNADQEKKVRKPALDSPVKKAKEQDAPRRLSFAQALKNEDELGNPVGQTQRGYSAGGGGPANNDVVGETFQPSRNSDDAALNESLVNLTDLRRKLDPGGGDGLEPGGAVELNPGDEKGFSNNFVKTKICDISAGIADETSETLNPKSEKHCLDSRERISESRDVSVEPRDNDNTTRENLQDEDDETTDEEETTTKKRTPGKRIRKRRKHQKKPRTPKPFETVEKADS